MIYIVNLYTFLYTEFFSYIKIYIYMKKIQYIKKNPPYIEVITCVLETDTHGTQ